MFLFYFVRDFFCINYKNHQNNTKQCNEKHNNKMNEKIPDVYIKKHFVSS